MSGATGSTVVSESYSGQKVRSMSVNDQSESSEGQPSTQGLPTGIESGQQAASATNSLSDGLSEKTKGAICFSPVLR